MIQGMPSGILRAYTGGSFAAALVLRSLFLKRAVNASSLLKKAGTQFFIEYALALSAGLFTFVLTRVFFSIPLYSGGLFFIGFVAFGFFIAVDMSLEKEREVIKTVMARPDLRVTLQKIYPMTRKFFLIAVVANLMVMVIIILIIGRDLAWLTEIETAQMNIMKEMTSKTVFKEISFAVAVLLVLIINIIYSYSKNLKLLFQMQTRVLESVSNGDLSTLVPVATSDEFGMIATHTNKMIYGLRDRIRMLARLNVAKEIQANLLPGRAPDVPGLDISGISLYCEEVGGDYYDYFKFSGTRVGIAVTDSSDHGVGAGLHMTTIRAFLRYGAEDYQGALPLIRSVNRHLAGDGSESGHFTTVFFADIDLEQKKINWIRAGHEPALLYSPESGEFTRLLGSGMALGVEPDAEIYEYEILGWEKDSILAIVSDGLKESRNSAGEMYGENRIRALITRYPDQPAQTIQKELIRDLKGFIGKVPIADDITVVIVKLV
nr:PP2C family protein-serine/threonine phosphatase [Desulfobacula sp.]